MEIFTGAAQFELHAAVQPLSSSILPLQQAHCMRRGSTRSSRRGFIVPQSSMEQYFVEDVNRSGKDVILRRPRKIGETMKMKNLTLPECEFKISGIPNAGNGVHATQDFKKGDIVGEYGGEVITAKEARRRRDIGDDSHIRSVGRVVSNGFGLDGRLRGDFTKEYYAQNHLMGSFFNEALTPGAVNCKYVERACMHQIYWHPYRPSITSTGGDFAVATRVFLVATRDGKAGDEFLVTYGKGYSRKY